MAKSLDPLDLDIIIDYAFLEDLSPEDLTLFSDVSRMIEAMNGLNEEEEVLANALHGDVPTGGINGVMRSAQEEPAKSDTLYEAYFT